MVKLPIFGSNCPTSWDGSSMLQSTKSDQNLDDSTQLLWTSARSEGFGNPPEGSSGGAQNKTGSTIFNGHGTSSTGEILGRENQSRGLGNHPNSEILAKEENCRELGPHLRVAGIPSVEIRGDIAGFSSMTISGLSHVVTLLILSQFFIMTISGLSHVVTFLILVFNKIINGLSQNSNLSKNYELLCKRSHVLTTYFKNIFTSNNLYKHILILNHFNSDQMFHLNTLGICQYVDRIFGYCNGTIVEWRMFHDMLMPYQLYNVITEFKIWCHMIDM